MTTSPRLSAGRMCLTTCSVSLLLMMASPGFGGTFRTITIDDSYDDWLGVPVLDADPVDAASGPDIGDTQIANDNQNLYIRNTFHNGIALSTYIAMDVDQDVTTGFDIFGLGLIGSEAGWQNDFAFEEANGIFNSGGLAGDYFGGGHALLSSFANSPNRELAISLSALFGSTMTTIFPDDQFDILIWTNEGDVSRPITYTLAVPEPIVSGWIVFASLLMMSRPRRSA